MNDFSVDMNEYLPLRDVVFNTLRKAILKGELKPGERLMEIALAEKLGVSRTPVREAMRTRCVCRLNCFTSLRTFSSKSVLSCSTCVCTRSRCERATCICPFPLPQSRMGSEMPRLTYCLSSGSW